MKYKLSLSLAFSFAALLSVAQGAGHTWPAPFEAEYEGRKFPLTAQAKLRLSRWGDYYRYTMRGSVYMAFYEVTETYDCSVLQVRDGELYPIEYVHRDRRKSERNLHTRFDWRNRTARTTQGDSSVLAIEDLPGSAWDVMSIQVRLRADAQALAAGDERKYAVVEKGALTHQRAQHEGIETIEVNGTELRAAKVTVESPKRLSTFWFAPDHAWLPVRLVVGGVTLELASPPAQAAQPAQPAGDAAPSCE